MRTEQKAERTPAALPHLVAESLRIAWQAGRRELTVMLAMQGAMIVLIVGVLLAARELASHLVDADAAGDGAGTLAPELVAVVILVAAFGAANAVQLHRQRILGELCLREGEGRLLAVTTSVELAAFDDSAFHDAVERARLAVVRLPSVIASVSGLLRALAGAIGASVALVVIEPLLAPVIALVLAPTWLAARRRGRVFHRFAHRITPQDRERRYLTEVLSDRDAAEEVRAYGYAAFLEKRWATLWDGRVGELRAVAGRQLRVAVLADVLASVVLGGTLVALASLTLSGDIDVGSAGVIAVTVVLLGQRLAFAAASTANLTEGALFIDDLLALTARSSGGAPAAPAQERSRRPAAAPAVRAEQVSFSYAGDRGAALREVSLEIGAGEAVALVGENGSGKTTLAKVIAGLYVPDRGRVIWNGTEMAGDARERLRRDVAVVFQDFQRYALSAELNVGLGRHDRLPDPEGVRDSARRAGAHAQIGELPEGYATVLGTAFAGGIDLSTGQWQRVALARALFRDAPFVILDEPTASLDAQAERDLFADIRELLAGRSVLMISHRLSSVRAADRIYVLHRGAIVEAGTHDELIASGGRYARMFATQAAPYR